MVRAVVAADYSGDQGAIILHRDEVARLWHDTQVSHFNLFLKPGATSRRCGANRAELGGSHLVKVLTIPQTLAYHQGMVDRAFAFTYAIQLLVVAVTLAGIFDLLTTQILERRRELGILRALGSDDSRIARSIRLEALAIGVAGAVLGCLLGVGTSLLWVRVHFRILIGYVLEHHYALVTARGVSYWRRGRYAGGQLAARRALRLPAWTRSGTSRPALGPLQEEDVSAAREDPPALPDPQVLTAARVEPEAVLARHVSEKAVRLQLSRQRHAERRPAFHRRRSVSNRHDSARSGSRCNRRR